MNVTVNEQEAELRQILDFTPQLSAVYGPNRERLYVNRVGLDYLGLTLEEWLQTAAECQQDRPQEEPDGEPNRSSAPVLRGVERRCRRRRAGRIFHRRRRLPQYPFGAGHRQGGHREQLRVVHPPWRARHRESPPPPHQHRG